jgi:hypothetical protein
VFGALTKEMALESFWKRVEKGADPYWDCSEWIPTRNKGRHGSCRWEGRQQGAHRVSWQIHVGPIPDGHEVHHLCLNPCCVNPVHLQVLSPADHRRCHPPLIRPECKRGHRYEEGSYRVGKAGERLCLACMLLDREIKNRRSRELFAKVNSLPCREAKEKKMHCLRGHEFNEANTIIRSDGRECRECKNWRRRVSKHDERESAY